MMKYSTVTEMHRSPGGNTTLKQKCVNLSEYQMFSSTRIFENFFIVGLQETDCTDDLKVLDPQILYSYVDLAGEQF